MKKVTNWDYRKQWPPRHLIPLKTLSVALVNHKLQKKFVTGSMKVLCMPAFVVGYGDASKKNKRINCKVWLLKLVLAVNVWVWELSWKTTVSHIGYAVAVKLYSVQHFLHFQTSQALYYKIFFFPPFLQVWAGPLSGNRLVVAFWNRCSKAATITAKWEALCLESSTSVSIRDLWQVSN